MKSELPPIKLTTTDVDHVVESLAISHPELAAADTKSTRVRRALIESLLQETATTKSKHLLTSLADSLTAPVALGIIAAAAFPELPIAALIAAGIGYGAKELVDYALGKAHSSQPTAAADR